MEKSDWVNNAEGNWTVLSNSPLVYRADDNDCKITIFKDDELLRTLSFKKELDDNAFCSVKLKNYNNPKFYTQVKFIEIIYSTNLVDVEELFVDHNGYWS